MDIYVTHPVLIWLGLAAALLAIEVVTGSGWLLWASGAAAVAALAVGVIPDLSLAATLTGFAVLTIVSALTARRFLPRSVPGGADINDNAARVIGHHGRMVGAFEDGVGRVFVDGKEWAALADEGAQPAAGAAVVVTGVDGARLRVRSAP